MTFSEMVDDLRVFLEERGIERTALMGHSVGGKTAMVFALLYGQMVDTLIVVDIAPVAYDHSFSDLVRAMQRLDLSGGLPRTALDKRLARDIPDKALRTFLMQNLVSERGRTFWRINLDAIAAHMADLTGFPDVEGFVYDGRALFLSGEQSDYVAPRAPRTHPRAVPVGRVRGDRRRLPPPARRAAGALPRRCPPVPGAGRRDGRLITQPMKSPHPDPLPRSGRGSAAAEASRTVARSLAPERGRHEAPAPSLACPEAQAGGAG